MITLQGRHCYHQQHSHFSDEEIEESCLSLQLVSGRGGTSTQAVLAHEISLLVSMLYPSQESALNQSFARLSSKSTRLDTQGLSSRVLSYKQQKPTSLFKKERDLLRGSRSSHQ